MGVGVVEEIVDDANVKIHFWGGGSALDVHKPCFYSNEKQEEELKVPFYYGKPVFWRDKGKRVTNVKVTIEVSVADIYTSFKWTKKKTVPRGVLCAHCPAVIMDE